MNTEPSHSLQRQLSWLAGVQLAGQDGGGEGAAGGPGGGAEAPAGCLGRCLRVPPMDRHRCAPPTVLRSASWACCRSRMNSSTLRTLQPSSMLRPSSIHQSLAGAVHPAGSFPALSSGREWRRRSHPVRGGWRPLPPQQARGAVARHLHVPGEGHRRPRRRQHPRPPGPPHAPQVTRSPAVLCAAFSTS